MKRDEYATLHRLETRQRVHLRHSVPPDDIEATTLAAASVRPGATVLDIGCGTGSFLTRLVREIPMTVAIGLDLSPAAVRAQARRGIPVVRADASQLPFADGSVDVVFARHMLDHVGDVPGVLRECRRVLRPGGRLVAVVNHRTQAPALTRLIASAVASHGIRVPPPYAIHSDNITALLDAEFDSSHQLPVDGELVFAAPEPLVEFALSLLYFYGVPDDSPHRDSICARMTREIRDAFREPGFVWADPKGYSVNLALKPTGRHLVVAGHPEDESHGR